MSRNSEWVKANLGDLIDSISENNTIKQEPVVLINTSDVLEGKVLNHSKVKNENLKGQFKKSFKKNDILLSEIRPINGRNALIDFNPDNYIASTKLMVLRPKDENLNVKFLYYLLTSKNSLKYLQTLAESRSGTFPQITFNTLSEVEVNLPTLVEQKAIVNILSSFDSKIENNNAIIENLEEQAQTIFKSCFLDSELFQDEDLENKKFGDFFQFIKGKKPKTISDSYEKGYVPYLVKKYIDGNEATFASIDDGILIDDLDIFMLMDGANSGNVYYGYHGILGSTFSLLKNDNEMVNEYIYWYLLINQESVKNQNTGSAIPHANKDYINNLEVILPIDMETNRVLKTLRDIRLYTINLRRESNKLTATRDTLLPKLMSGEIQVGEAIEVE